MHFHVEVLLPPGTPQSEILQLVEDALCECKAEMEWDWHQIGGRWTGAHDGYDPDADRANRTPCPRCAGTGVQYGNYCHLCYGHGVTPAWPTDYKRHPGDMTDLDSLAGTKPLLTAEYLVARAESHELAGKQPVLEKLKELGISDGLLVTVDCHN